MSRKRKKLPEGEFEAIVGNLSHDGRGVCEINGKKTFLFGALPAEKIKFHYKKTHNRYDEGIVTEVIEASTQRTQAKCSSFGICGGCSYQHLNHKFQVEHKEKIFLEQLAHISHIKPEELLPILTANPWSYRRKARLSVKYVPKKNKVIIGFREKNSHLVADIKECNVLSPSIGNKITLLSELIYSLSAREVIPQIEIAVANITALIIRHLSPLPTHDLQTITEFAKKEKMQIYLQPKGLDSIELLCPEKADPLLSYELPKYDLKLKFHPRQFIQVNDLINKKMIAQAMDLLAIDSNDHILDLFCGIGNFSLPLAKYAKRIVGIEGDDSAVLQARDNAKLNQITNCEFHTANLFSISGHESWLAHHYTKLLLDPPRAGAQEFISWLTQKSPFRPDRIVYVSCNPATLARDSKILLENGYRLQKAGIMDMFPHTQHVEAIALFI